MYVGGLSSVPPHPSCYDGFISQTDGWRVPYGPNRRSCIRVIIVHLYDQLCRQIDTGWCNDHALARCG